MRKVIRKKCVKGENLHLIKEDNRFLVKVVYNPTVNSNDFLYSIIIKNKETNSETKQDIGVFNLTKAMYSLGYIVIEDVIKIIPKKRTTSVYNLHENDIQVYTFHID